MGIYQLRYGALRFSLTHASEPTSVLFLYKRASNYITDNQYFSLLMFWQIRYVH